MSKENGLTRRGKVYDAIYHKIVRDARSLTGFLPRKRVKLSDMLRRYDPCIELRNGETHCFSKDELRELARSLPWYLHDFTYLPLVLRKEANNLFKVLGEEWDRRIVYFLLYKKLSLEGIRVLKEGEALALLKKYKTLVFTTLSLNFINEQS